MGKVQVDARGKNCPEPVLMTKNAVSPDVTEVETLVDNPIARENVSRFMKSKGFSVECTEKDGTISVRGVMDANPRPSATDEETKRPTQFADAHRASAYPFQKGAINPRPSATPFENGANDAAYAVLITHPFIGGEDKELGEVLMKAYLGALGQEDIPPSVIILMNGGVKLAIAGASTCEHLEALASKSVKVLLCGTCLKHFGLLDNIGVGQVSNMFEISEYLAAASHVVSF